MNNVNLDRYKDFEKKELFGGLRCKTFLFQKGKEKKIYQTYSDGATYQAKKKYDIIKLIKETTNCDFIPDAYGYVANDNDSWLLTEFKEGKTLDDIRKENKDFNLSLIAEDISRALLEIHSVKGEKTFGWITDNGVFRNDKFYQYLESELERFYTPLSDNLSYEEVKEIFGKSSEAMEFIKNRTETIDSVITWYDLNPKNIIIEKKDGKYTLSGIIDPGGAKYGIREWDLAFIKFEICQNDEEFNSILNCYSSGLEKLGKTVDIELINTLGIFVEMDDMVISVLDKINLPIPYCSNFKNIIKSIHNKNDDSKI